MRIEEDRFGLRPLWTALLEIYGVFAKICDKHGLRYYLTDGSAIGAIRHKGFIPWDDDFDVSMPREDYDQFMAIASSELPEHLKIVNWRNTPEFPLLFSKLQDTRAEVVEKVEKEIGGFLSGGLFIDIFPIDGYPESSIERFYTRALVFLLSCIIRFRCDEFCHQTKKGRVVWIAGAFLNMLCPWLTRQKSKKLCERFLLKHPFEKSNHTGRASLRLTLLNRDPIPKECWGRGVRVPFCGILVPVPDDYDYYLRVYYGDYMKLPPLDDQHATHHYSWRCPWWLGPTNTGDLASTVAQA